MEPQNQILGDDGSLYKITDKLATGGQGTVFVVKKEKDDDEYVAKVELDNKRESLLNEIRILNLLNQNYSPRIINLISSGIGQITYDNKIKNNKGYIILEYAKGGNLYDFIHYPKEGFGERKSKLIFCKILEGVNFCHTRGICHLDIKLENIFLDSNYFPKIGDFGCARQSNTKLKEYLGTQLYYMAPEILKGKAYDGFKVDIFSLGACLMNLVYGQFGFDHAAPLYDELYTAIAVKDTDNYWIKLNVDLKDISPEYKDLYFKMVAYFPQDRPKNIDEILNHKWFEEIKKMSVKEREDLEQEIKADFENRAPKVQNKSQTVIQVIPPEDYPNPIKRNRSIGESKIIYFKNDLNPKDVKSSIKNYYFIKIQGKINPKDFMNDVCNELTKKYGKACKIEASSKKSKFNVLFEGQSIEVKELPDNIKEKLKQLGIDCDNEENIEEDDLTIQVKLFKTSDGHLLRFVKKEGTRKNFIDKFEEITKLIK